MTTDRNQFWFFQLLATLLRMAIGWHFLYEGLVKLFSPDWTAAAFLVESKWLFSGFFHWIVAHPQILELVDILNITALILIGAGLLLGVLIRPACMAGIALLTLYYLANPALIGYFSGLRSEGSYLLIDKNVIELLALLLLIFFPTWGIESWPIWRMAFWRRNKPGGDKQQTGEQGSLARRDWLKNLITLPVGAAFVFAFAKKRQWDSWEEKHLLSSQLGSQDAVTSATIKTYQFSALKDLRGTLPQGQIGSLKIGRLILGGNLINGWAHSRDLIYVSKLVKAYHTTQKVFDTFQLAEQCGVNMLLTNPALAPTINAYWRKMGGKL